MLQNSMKVTSAEAHQYFSPLPYKSVKINFIIISKGRIIIKTTTKCPVTQFGCHTRHEMYTYSSGHRKHWIYQTWIQQKQQDKTKFGTFRGVNYVFRLCPNVPDPTEELTKFQVITSHKFLSLLNSFLVLWSFESRAAMQNIGSSPTMYQYVQ